MSHNWWFWGRIIYGVPLSLTGLVYIINPHGTVESFTSFIPGELALVYISGFLWLMLGCAVALNFHTRLVCRGIIGLLCAYLVIIHIPALTTGEHINIVCFELLRNLSLMGGAFFILALDQQASVHRAKKEHQTIY
jgi:uncharacterized membrane protein YphA (DoxX/SURF4 family)